MRGRFDYIRLKVPPDGTRIFALLFVQFLVPGIPHCFHWFLCICPDPGIRVFFHDYTLIFRVRVLIEFQRVFFFGWGGTSYVWNLASLWRMPLWSYLMCFWFVHMKWIFKMMCFRTRHDHKGYVRQVTNFVWETAGAT